MSAGGTCSHDHECGEHNCGAEWSLYKHVDTLKVRALNEAVPDSVKSVFRSWDERLNFDKYLDSNEDDPELIVFVPFTCDVKIRSICVIGAPDGLSPSALRVFTNREDVDFSSANDLIPVQEWQLAEDSRGELEYQTKFAKFQGISNITLHFPRNFGGDVTRIHFIGFKGEATQNKREAVVSVVYEAMANPKDHKLSAEHGAPQIL